MLLTFRARPLTDTQKDTIRSIVNIFETGKPEGDYSKVTLIKGDPGHLTYGKSQTTLASGNLYFLIKAYCNNNGTYSNDFKPYLDKLINKDLSLDNNSKFKSLLRHAASDPVMRKTQDGFFDRAYLDPALKRAENMGIETALGKAVVYDSYVHGSFKRISSKTTNELGNGPNKIDEKKWIAKYIELRKEWLANHTIKILNKTVYRMNAFLDLIKQDKWNLELPIKIRGNTITNNNDKIKLPNSPRTEDDFLPVLKLNVPFAKGKYVKLVQDALKKNGYDIVADGVFGPKTKEAVMKFQKDNMLLVDGIVGPQTYDLLDI